MVPSLTVRATPTTLTILTTAGVGGAAGGPRAKPVSPECPQSASMLEFAAILRKIMDCTSIIFTFFCKGIPFRKLGSDSSLG